MAKPTLTEISGIGPAMAAELAKVGIDGVRSLASAPLEKIQAVKGFGAAKATAVREAARMLAPPPEEPTKKKTKKKAKKKGKKGKKGRPAKGKAKPKGKDKGRKKKGKRKKKK